jgi:hypothetical protein
MKLQFKLAVISLVLLLIVCPLQSQPAQSSGVETEIEATRQQILKKGLRGYEASLRMDIETVVESAIFQAAKMSLTRPEQNYSKISAELKRLSFAAPTSSMRYKAYLAACVVSDPARFRRVVPADQLRAFTEERRNEFFANIAAELETQFAAGE